MESIYNKSFDELVTYFESIGEKKFKATQVFEWLYLKRVKSFDEMSNIKKEIIDVLKRDYVIENITLDKVERDIEVNKYLFTLNDGNHIESVLMRHDYGTSICISSQVGCNMGCRFCESGRLKKVRNLTAGEMVEQILKVEEDINTRITHVVIMGIGEPFDNYDNVINFVKIINHSKGLEIGARHITISTCGLVPKIEEFSNLDLQVNLALSLHAPNDEIRNKIMPVNNKYNVDMLLAACRRYFEKTGRRISFEYSMIHGVNDTVYHANLLAEKLSGTGSHVNLILLNNVEESPLKPSTREDLKKFTQILKDRGINATVRRRLGSDIDASCGQLRRNYNKENKKNLLF